MYHTKLHPVISYFGKIVKNSRNQICNAVWNALTLLISTILQKRQILAIMYLRDN